MSIEQYSSGARSRFDRGFRGPRLAKLLPWLFSAGLLAGCAQRYDLILTNGTRITNVTKPVKNLEAGAYYYKAVDGSVSHVSAGRVVEIKPHTDKNTTPGTLKQ
jgi:hypothetical protein